MCVMTLVPSASDPFLRSRSRGLGSNDQIDSFCIIGSWGADSSEYVVGDSVIPTSRIWYSVGEAVMPTSRIWAGTTGRGGRGGGTDPGRKTRSLG